MHDILSPLIFRNGVTARNRIAVAPMTTHQSHEDGSLSDAELDWLAPRAAGGFGAVITCAVHVALEGKGWHGELGAFDDRLIPDLTRVSDTIQGEGAAAIAQIFHGGLRSPRELLPSAALSASDDPQTGARAATEADILRVVDQFVSAAKRAEAAGMTGVEIHGAHGYLLTQFLSRTQNRRTDHWGGSYENRARLLRMITRAVRAQVSDAFVVGVRLSPEDSGSAVGLDLDESLQLARELCDDGIDYLHVSLWDVIPNTTKRPDKHAIPLFKQSVDPDVPIMVAGKIWTAEDALRVMQLGSDAIALGRAAILNPDWPKSVATPHFSPRKPGLSRTEFRKLGLSDPFIDALAQRPNFVTDA